MGLFDTTQLGLEAALSGSALRQKAIANNIANANTAGYKRQDVDFHAALQVAMDAPDAQTRVAGLQFSPQTDSSTSSRLDGNNVDIDAEMASLSENSLEYNALVQVSRARLTMLQIAMGTRQA